MPKPDEKRGEIRVEWSHVEGCPGNVSILNPKWVRQRELCTCGMPSYWEMDVMRETTEESWKERVRSGEADP